MTRAKWACVLYVSCALVFGCEANDPEPRFYKEQSAHAKERPQEPASGERAPESKTSGVVEAPASEQRPRELVRRPTSPDPLKGTFKLKDALADLRGKGKLHATIASSLGTIECSLFDDKAPTTVANFVGLARGLRPFWDPKAGAWVKRPLYDGTTFHRVIPDFMIQGGDHLGTGSGDVGYTIPDELHPKLKHDRAGLLCMANRGPDTNGGQFFITDAAAPHLTAMKSYTIFGDCEPLEVVHKIATAPKASPGSERPEPPVVIEKVTISRR